MISKLPINRFLMVGIVFAFACRQDSKTSNIEGDGIYQVSTLDALAMGDYYGKAAIKDLVSKGDFGVGTFVGVDGEMVVLDQVFYQIKDDGKVYEVSGTVETPFAVLKHFEADSESSLVNISSLAVLTQKLDESAIHPTDFYAIRIQGEFDSLVVRSVPAQVVPYPPLSTVVANQITFSHANVRGTMVGFYFPAFSGSINAAEYHFHFISDDRTIGGHVLDCQINEATVGIDQASDLQVDF